MKNLTFEDTIFVKLKLQKSMNQSQTQNNNFQKKSLFSSQTLIRLQQYTPQKQPSKQPPKNLSPNDWLVKKQIRLKSFFDRKIKQEQTKDYQFRISDSIQFRTKQNWLKLKQLKSQNIPQIQQKDKKSPQKVLTKTKRKVKNDQIKKNQFGKIVNSHSILRLSNIKKHSPLRLKLIDNETESFADQQQIKHFQALTQIQENCLKIKGQKQFFNRKTSQTMLKTTDSTPKSLSKQQKTMNSIKNKIKLQYCSFQSQQGQELKNKYSQLQRRLDNLLRPSRQRKNIVIYQDLKKSTEND